MLIGQGLIEQNTMNVQVASTNNIDPSSPISNQYECLQQQQQQKSHLESNTYLNENNEIRRIETNENESEDIANMILSPLQNDDVDDECKDEKEQ